MGVLKSVVEPGAIAIIFTLGAVINYRPNLKTRSHSSSPLIRPRSPTLLSNPSDPKWIRPYLPDNTRFEQNLTSRLLASFPFIFEALYWNATYWTYQVARARSALLIAGNETVWDVARSHALDILSFEIHFGIDIEKTVQQWTLRSAPWLMHVYAVIYHSHIIVAVIFVVYAYTYFKRDFFQKMRRTMAASNFLAFVVLSLYRVMPPRLLPARYGYVDILHPNNDGSGSIWTHNRFRLTIAAMPSLHFGTASFIAYCLIRSSPHKPLRNFTILWPIAMFFTITATANHFILDAFVGALIPVVAWRFNTTILILRPIEEWALWLARTTKPETADQSAPMHRRAMKQQDEEESLC